jgi:hypothetical protein
MQSFLVIQVLLLLLVIHNVTSQGFNHGVDPYQKFMLKLGLGPGAAPIHQHDRKTVLDSDPGEEEV